MSAPKMTRHEMKQNDLVTILEKAGGYARSNPTVLRNVGVAAAGVLVMAALVYLFLSGRASAAEALLKEAQTRFSSPVVPTGAQPNDPFPSYASEAERDAAALSSFTKLAQDHGRTSQGRLALYYQGVLLVKLGRNDEAKSALEAYVDRASSPLLASLARAQLAQLLLRGGDAAAAAKIYADLAEAKDSAYPRDWALFFLAETQAQMGNKVEAAATYQKIVTEFPTSAFIAEAKERAKGA